MNKPICGNCLYYVNHYIKNGRRYQSIEQGLCTCFTRRKNRKASAMACFCFEPQKSELKIPENQ